MRLSRILTKEEWMRRKRRRNLAVLVTAFILFIAIIVLSVLLIKELKNTIHRKQDQNSEADESLQTLSNGTVIKQEFLTPNLYSRPKKKLKKVKSIVIHYTANPGTTAEANRDYFEGLAESKTTSASSHFVVGIKGEIIQCIPLTEVSYASNDRNKDTVSIECCHPDKTGKFSDKTYASLVELAATLCKKYNLKKDDIIRHYDVSGKKCPLYYVDHEEAWNKLKDDITSKMKDLT
jgi:N-acetylmuramoyl-L-alanine amidase CwlA